MIWLLRLYPRTWQRRYRVEVEEHLRAEPLSIRLLLDVLAGAVDAHTNPQWIPATPESSGGDDPVISFFENCAAREISVAEQRRSAIWMLGTSLVFALSYLWLDARFGENPFSQAFIFSAFPIAVILSSQHSYLKPYSSAARVSIMVGGSIAIYVFFLGIMVIAELI